MKSPGAFQTISITYFCELQSCSIFFGIQCRLQFKNDLKVRRSFHMLELAYLIGYFNPSTPNAVNCIHSQRDAFVYFYHTSFKRIYWLYETVSVF